MGTEADFWDERAEEAWDDAETWYALGDYGAAALAEWEAEDAETYAAEARMCTQLPNGGQSYYGYSHSYPSVGLYPASSSPVYSGRDTKNAIWIILILVGIFVTVNIFESIPPKIAMDTEEFLILCANGEPREIKAAIKNGANVKAKNEFGWSALSEAAENNPDPKVIALLLENGVDVNTKNRYGMTALMNAAEGNPNPEVVAFLLRS
ncbi:hypothetical protein FACS1894204_11860 [Synergistales bacterium]|nr:hypothetical protein FACS1894204_11860 [Synergistales bacterium]